MSQKLMNRKLHKNEADKLAPEMTMGTESMNQACPRKGKCSEGKHCLWTENRFDHKPTEKNLQDNSLSSNKASRVWDEMPITGAFWVQFNSGLLGSNTLILPSKWTTNFFISFPVDCYQQTLCVSGKMQQKTGRHFMHFK